MVEAVDVGDGPCGMLDFDWEGAADRPEQSLADRVAKVFKGTPEIYCLSRKIDKTPFMSRIENAVRDSDIAKLILAKLKEKGLDNYERFLGKGARGQVFQLRGTGAFEGKKLALKLFPYDSAYSSNYSYWKGTNRITEEGPQGDAIALQFPKGYHLGRAYAILTYDGKEVHYLEEIDPQLHSGHLVIGVLSRAIQGGTLAHFVRYHPMNAEEVRGYGKHLAEAIHGLHKVGYLHGDLIGRNILVKEPKEGKLPYRIKVIDFDHALRILPLSNGGSYDWKCFRNILRKMASKTELEFDSDFNDLLELLGSKHFNSGEEVLNHPFFALPRREE